MKKNIIKIKYQLTAAIIMLSVSVLATPVMASKINSANIIKLVNESREKEGIVSLKENETLDKIAQDKLNDMIDNNYFAHTSPKGINPWYWFQKEGYDYKYAGENLAINFVKAEDEHAAWMKSTTHRKNILNPNYQEIGVAVGAGEINGQTSIIAVQEFGSREGSGVSVNDSKNFSGKEKTNLVKEGEKIGPSVLSVKDINSGGNTPANPTGGNGSMFDSMRHMMGNREALYFYSLLVNLVILLLMLTFSPAVFVILAFSRMWMGLSGKNSVAIKFLDNIHENRLVRIHLL